MSAILWRNGTLVWRAGQLVWVEDPDSCECCGDCVYDCCDEDGLWKCEEDDFYDVQQTIEAYVTVNVVTPNWFIEVDTLTYDPFGSYGRIDLDLSGLSGSYAFSPEDGFTGPGLDPADCRFRGGILWRPPILTTIPYTRRKASYTGYDITETGNAWVQMWFRDSPDPNAYLSDEYEVIVFISLPYTDAFRYVERIVFGKIMPDEFSMVGSHLFGGGCDTALPGGDIGDMYARLYQTYCDEIPAVGFLDAKYVGCSGTYSGYYGGTIEIAPMGITGSFTLTPL